MLNFKIKVNKDIAFIHPEIAHAATLFTIIDRDRPHLEKFVEPLIATKTQDDEKSFIQEMLEKEIAGTSRLFLISYQGQICGCIDLHKITADSAEIGYWLSSKYTGRGIMTQCVKELCNLAFNNLNLKELGLIANVKNMPSRNVAKRVGFTDCGVRNDLLKSNGQYVPAQLYKLKAQ